MTDDFVPFTRRFGLVEGPPVDRDFPHPARVALFHVLDQLVEGQMIRNWNILIGEMERLARVPPEGFSDDQAAKQRALELLESLPWQRVFELCERTHHKLLSPTYYWNGNESEEHTSLESVRADFSVEVNQILVEENIAFEFRNGRFVRPGRLNYQKAAAAAQRVLARPELKPAASHYMKAQRFFEGAVGADYPNTVKEAVAALEAAAKALFPWTKETDFRAILKKLQGTDAGQVPPTLAKGMEHLYSFRGAATGVAHGGATGGEVTPEVAELVLSLAAAFITYLAEVETRATADLPF